MGVIRPITSYQVHMTTCEWLLSYKLECWFSYNVISNRTILPTLLSNTQRTIAGQKLILNEYDTIFYISCSKNFNSVHVNNTFFRFGGSGSCIVTSEWPGHSDDPLKWPSFSQKRPKRLEQPNLILRNDKCIKSTQLSYLVTIVQF